MGVWVITPFPCWYKKGVIPISDLRKQEEEETKLYPELNQGLKILNEKGEWVLGREKETFLSFPRDFMFSGILRELSLSSVNVLCVIAGLVGIQRFTNAGNNSISRYSGLTLKTIKKALKELEFYHVIKRNLIPSGARKRKRRIVLHRWDTAKEILIKENKLKLDENGKILFLIPNPFKKC